MIKPVILLSDAFFFVLIALLALYFYYARTRTHLRAIWRKLARNKAAMISAVFLVFYFMVAFLDSLHFHKALDHRGASNEVIYSNEIVSVLDQILLPLHERSEKSYSAPFATHAYVKEFYIEDGATKQHYPRLQYGGAHLNDLEQLQPFYAWVHQRLQTIEQQRAFDIGVRIFEGIFFGLLSFLLIYLLICFFHAKRTAKPIEQIVPMLVHDHHELPWRAVMITLMLLVVTIFTVAYVSHYYHVLGTDKIGCGCAVSSSQKHTHRIFNRYTNDPDNVTFCANPGGLRRLFSGQDRRCHPISVHNAELSAGRAFGCCCNSDAPCLYGSKPRPI